jgi:tetratricopeptide (TPR) repeat protein
VLAKRIQIFGTGHPSVAQTFHGLAHLLEFRGRKYYEQSVELYNKGLIIREEVLGPEHPAVAQTLYNLVDIYYRRWQKFELAEPLFQRAIAIYEKAQLMDHPELAHILRSYAILLSALNRNAEAKENSARAKAIRAKNANN